MKSIISTSVKYSETEAVSISYMHPTIQKTLSQIPNLVVKRPLSDEDDGKFWFHLVLLYVHFRQNFQVHVIFCFAWQVQGMENFPRRKHLLALVFVVIIKLKIQFLLALLLKSEEL